MRHGISPKWPWSGAFLRGRPFAGRIAATATVFIPTWLAGCAGESSTLDPASRSATEAAGLWWGMLGFATVVLIVLTVLWIYAMRRDPGGDDDTRQRRAERRWIVGGGLVLPLASITLLLAFGIPVGHRLLPLPDDDALRIDVTGHQWWWEVVYPESDIALRNTLTIPVDKPVDVHLRSADVIHSFWVPRLAGKLDVIPGHTNVLRLHATQTGTFRGVCAEFCGVGHAHMTFMVKVVEGDAFEDWLTEREGR